MATVTMDQNNFEALVRRDGVTMVDFWAAWCGPCKSFAPVFEKSSVQHPDVVFGKVDTEAQPGLAQAFRISAIPTLMVFRDGVLLFSEAGALPPAALEDLLKQVQALDMVAVHAEIAKQRTTSEAPATREA